MEPIPMIKDKRSFVSTRNACKLCSPLGASVALKGIEGCVPVIHGSQGCATYIRRYMISHYKEPVDIASSNFSEETTIFGGVQNLKIALKNVINQYRPQAIGIATTCLSETIGEDVNLLLHQIKSELHEASWPALFSVSTPSYQGTHMDGFHATVFEVLKHFTLKTDKLDKINLFPGFVSPADIRHLKEICSDFGLDATVLPDYSTALDNPVWNHYHRIPKGGTPLKKIKTCGGAFASLELGAFCEVRQGGRSNGETASPAMWLEKEHDVQRFASILPIGVNSCDAFFDNLQELSGKKTPEKYEDERGRLLDAYADGHKYVFGKKAVVYGEEDFVLGLCSFLDEIGIQVVLAASGANTGKLQQKIKEHCPVHGDSIKVMSDADFEVINEISHDLKPDIIIGNSKGYYIARNLDIPMVRVGFPIHDRLGGQRILHLGYRGTQNLFDTIANALIDYKQSHSPIGYKYM